MLLESDLLRAEEGGYLMSQPVRQIGCKLGVLAALFLNIRLNFPNRQCAQKSGICVLFFFR